MEGESELTAQYTEIFLREYKNRDDPGVKPVLQATAGVMLELNLPGGFSFYQLAHADDKIAVSLRNPAIKYSEQPSSSGNCKKRPAGTVCLGFSDGFIWLINESPLVWRTLQEGTGIVEVGVGTRAYYFHILNTNKVKTVPALL